MPKIPETPPITALLSRERSPRGTTRVATTLDTVPSTTKSPAKKPIQLRTVTRLRWHLSNRGVRAGDRQPAGCGPASPVEAANLSVFRYIADNWDTLGPQTVTHLAIVGVSMVVAAALGLLLGVV